MTGNNAQSKSETEEVTGNNAQFKAEIEVDSIEVLEEHNFLEIP